MSVLKKTLIVTGLAGGGTSVVAALLYLMGIDMKREKLFDSPETLHILLSRKYSKIVNGEGGTWGFKYPNISTESLRLISKRVVNPHFIFVYRDPIPKTNNYNTDLLYRRSGYLFDMSNFILNTGCLTLPISYEKLLIEKEDSVRKLARFCGIELDYETLQKCIDLIEPNDKFRKINKLCQ